MKKVLKKGIAAVMSVAMLAMTGCAAPAATAAASAPAEATSAASEKFVVGICNYVDDASLNQIVDSIEKQFEQLGKDNNVEIEIKYDNCNADANVMSQIIANFIADKVDLMIGVATPVAMAMQAATEDNQIPVVFSAVSDPVSTGIVASMEAPGANITGTSDMLNTEAIIKLILAKEPEIAKVGLLYDAGQDSSTVPIKEAKELLEANGIEVVERTGTNVEEVTLAAQALVEEGCTAVFTPTDNTVMQAELSIYETFAENGVLHYCGADSFALNGAFLGYGVNYVILGTETANMAYEILKNGKNPAEYPVMTFDNGIATINEDVCAKIGFDFEEAKTVFGEYCSNVQMIKTAESFE